MKNKFIVILSIALWSCQTEELVNTNCIELKLVDEICGNAIVQIMDAQYYNLGETSFNRGDGSTLENVFSTSLTCIGSDIPAVGSRFFVELVKHTNQPSLECTQCLAILYPMPGKFHAVKLAKNCVASSSDM